MGGINCVGQWCEIRCCDERLGSEVEQGAAA